VAAFSANVVPSIPDKSLVFCTTWVVVGSVFRNDIMQWKVRKV